ncbi:MAG: pseudouridine synthase [Candidatus Xenobia bacterium]
MECPLLYQDAHLVVANKPSGMVVHRGWGNDRVVAMTAVRDTVGQWVHPVHRLDRGASGALLMALDRDTARSLQGLFENAAIEKHYLAIVRGVTPEAGAIDHPLNNRQDGPRGDAVTTFRRLHVWERYSIVEAQPRTGRLHQIRRHLKHISHPIVGDVRYGKGEHNRYFREQFGLHRLALHAWRLSFIHPVSGQRLSIVAPLPPDLHEVVRGMGGSDLL